MARSDRAKADGKPTPMPNLIVMDEDMLNALLEKKFSRLERKLDAVHMEPPPRFITKAEYAKKIGKSLDTVRRYIREGRLETSGALVRNPDA